MDLFEARLRRIEADYDATIAAGERAAQRRMIEAAVAEHRTQYQVLSDHPDDTETCGIDTPSICDEALEQSSVIKPVVPRVVEPMTEDEIKRVKLQMASIKLKHQPSWASNLSDDQLIAIMRRIVDS